MILLWREGGILIPIPILNDWGSLECGSRRDLVQSKAHAFVYDDDNELFNEGDAEQNGDAASHEVEVLVFGEGAHNRVHKSDEEEG